MAHDIPDYDWSYAHQEWGRGLRFYQSRLRKLGFEDRAGFFLDAGCGTGQWVDALASLGREVVGVDVRPTRLEIASIFLDPRRTHIVRASIEALPFRDDAFSNIICYGVIMFVDAEKALSEFSRVSRSRCKLYLCWNAVGWSLNLMLTHHDLRVKMQGAMTILNTWMKRSGTKYFSARAMGYHLKRAGFRVLTEGGEGSISGEPIYSRTFLGFENVLEALTERS